MKTNPSSLGEGKQVTDGSNNKEEPRPIYSLDLGVDMVDILVGPTEQPFRVHKKLICSKVPYFDKMFNNGFVETTNKSRIS
ncbi:hypothetical protein B0J14DRAFT_646909 [Halenospora varia]|nr:hypothetical protein B0J14DRAFT_646909 [Halenospora varia]